MTLGWAEPFEALVGVDSSQDPEGRLAVGVRASPNVCGDSQRMDPGGLDVCSAVAKNFTGEEHVGARGGLLLAGGNLFPLGKRLYLLSSGKK